MPSSDVNTLFITAIELEKTAQRLYLDFEKKFAVYPEISAFWKKFAREEAGHARWLEKLYTQLSETQLSAPADPAIMEQASQMLNTFVNVDMAKVTNLEDAYQLALELESSETNAVLEFLITHFSKEEGLRDFVRVQLDGHVNHLSQEFPRQFRTAAQRTPIKAQT